LDGDSSVVRYKLHRGAAGSVAASSPASQRHHRQCVDVVSYLDASLITCEAVIAESCYLLRGVSRAAAILENVGRGVFLVPYRLNGNAANVGKLMKKYPKTPMDFADACLVDMAHDYQTGRILTLDGDFTIYRWGKNWPFEMLLNIHN
jgi:uncharacterized protein